VPATKVVGVLKGCIRRCLRFRIYNSVAMHLPSKKFCSVCSCIGNPDAAGKAIQYLQQAITVDPQHGLAHAALAQVFGMMSYWGFAPPAEINPLAGEEALKALQIEEWLSLAHGALRERESRRRSFRQTERSVWPDSWSRNSLSGKRRLACMEPAYTGVFRDFPKNSRRPSRCRALSSA
jgi:hypothetical protein